MLPLELLTPRLHLRTWRDSDLPEFVALNADPRVMEYFPACLSPEESQALLGRLCAHFSEHGFGVWALQERSSGRLIGCTGLLQLGAELPCAPGVEIAWRLVRAHWGQGYAQEAAQAALACAFEQLGLPQVVAFTTRSNLRSQQLMQRLGMLAEPAADFAHPRLPAGHPLRPHVLYRITAERWRDARLNDGSAHCS